MESNRRVVEVVDDGEGWWGWWMMEEGWWGWWMMGRGGGGGG